MGVRLYLYIHIYIYVDVLYDVSPIFMALLWRGWMMRPSQLDRSSNCHISSSDRMTFGCVGRHRHPGVGWFSTPKQTRDCSSFTNNNGGLMVFNQPKWWFKGDLSNKNGNFIWFNQQQWGYNGDMNGTWMELRIFHCSKTWKTSWGNLAQRSIWMVLWKRLQEGREKSAETFFL
jgi:hypothetical protein